MSGLYVARGRAYLVCPRLLELDPRHGEHPSRWAPCRRLAVDAKGRMLTAEGQLLRDSKGQTSIGCLRDHAHESALEDREGHTVNEFIWLPGCRHPEPGDVPACGCGRDLVWSDGDNPHP